MKPATARQRSRSGHYPNSERYEIRVKGQLEPRWAAWFDGMDLTPDGGTTVIEGTVPDQAALHGLLQKLRDIGLPLLSVTRADRGEPDPPTTQE